MINSDGLKNLQSYMFENGDEHSAIGVVKTFLNLSPQTPVSDLPSNGSFDEKTKSALAHFQKSKNLNPTGRMDLKTWLAVGAEMDLIQIDLVSLNDRTLRDLLQMGYRSKFPPSRANAGNPFGISGSVKKTSLNFGGASATGDFSFNIYVAAFAPFDWFGPLNLSRGDGNNRRFGFKLSESYRLRAESKMTASPGHHTYPYSVTKAADATTSYLIVPSAIQTGVLGVGVPTVKLKDAKSAGTITDEETGVAQPNGLHREGDSIRYHFHGNDDAFALWGKDSLAASDIDIHANIFFEYDYYSKPDSFVLKISGKITGDQFPAVETYALDRHGNGAMLGVWQVNEGDGPVWLRDGRFGLPFDKNSPMIDIDVSIIVEGGVFTGVQKFGRIVSLAEHNKQFTDLPPVKPGGFKREFLPATPMFPR